MSLVSDEDIAALLDSGGMPLRLQVGDGPACTIAIIPRDSETPYADVAYYLMDAARQILEKAL